MTGRGKPCPGLHEAGELIAGKACRRFGFPARPEKIEILQLPKSVIGRVIGKANTQAGEFYAGSVPWEAGATIKDIRERTGRRSRSRLNSELRSARFRECPARGARIDARDQTEDPVQAQRRSGAAAQLGCFWADSELRCSSVAPWKPASMPRTDMLRCRAACVACVESSNQAVHATCVEWVGSRELHVVGRQIVLCFFFESRFCRFSELVCRLISRRFRLHLLFWSASRLSVGPWSVPRSGLSLDRVKSLVWRDSRLCCTFRFVRVAVLLPTS